MEIRASSKKSIQNICCYYILLHWCLAVLSWCHFLFFCFYISYCCSLMLRLFLSFFFFSFLFFFFFFFTKSRWLFRCLLLKRDFHLDSMPFNSGWWRSAVMVDLLEPSPICTQDFWRSAKVITGFLTWNFPPKLFSLHWQPAQEIKNLDCSKLFPIQSVGSRSALRNLQEFQNLKKNKTKKFPTSVPSKSCLWALGEEILTSWCGFWWYCQQCDLTQVCVFPNSVW